MDKHGAIRVSGTRVTLDTVIARFNQGDSPEAIDYLARREAEGTRIRQEIEASYTPEQKARIEHLRRLAHSR